MVHESRSETPALWRRCLRAIAVTLVFALVGPPVGGFVFLPAIALASLGTNTDVSAMMLYTIFGIIYAMPLSYFIGIMPAVLTGGFVGAWLAFYGRMNWAAALATGLGAGVIVVGLSEGDMVSLFEKARDERGLPVIVSCLAATMVCWAIVRTWAMPPHAMFGRAAK